MSYQEFGVHISDIIMSHERPEHKQLANDLFQRRGLPRICKQYKARSVLGRLEKVRWYLQPEAAPQHGPNPAFGAPMAFFMSGGLVFPADDPDELGLRPVGVEAEIPGFVWGKTPDGQRSKEHPDNGCPNHGCDAMGMVLEEAFNDVRFTESDDLQWEPVSGSIESSELAERRLLGQAPPERKRRKRR